jgi:hypothetical protein
MTKVYKIGNKEIVLEDRKSEKYWGAYNIAYARDIHDALVAVLEALDGITTEKTLQQKQSKALDEKKEDYSDLLKRGYIGPEIELVKWKEECKHDSGYTCGSCNSCGKNNPMIGGKGEPKSTLREATSDIIFGVHKYPELADFTNDLTKFQTNLYADKIISLFKDTLLREVEYKFYGANDPKVIDIINLIKNI